MTAPLSRIGLGCSRMGSFNNPATLAQSTRLVEQAVALGVSVIDTANIYGQGDSERAIGRAICGNRDAVFLMTKLGQDFSLKMRLLRPFKPIVRPLLRGRTTHQAIVSARAGQMAPSFARTGYAATLDASLARLRTDRVDALFLHSPPDHVIGDPAVVAQLAALKQAGKLVHYGVSVDDEAGLVAALAMPGLSIVQMPYALLATPRTFGNVIVIAREVMTGQPQLLPLDAIRTAARDPRVTTALVGTTSRDHLAAAVAAQ